MMTSATATFHPFSRLPKELQLQIWEEACFDVRIARHTAGDRAGLHYVDVDQNDGQNSLTIRAFGRVMPGDEEGRAINKSAYFWDAGLWTACRQSRKVIIQEAFFICALAIEFDPNWASNLPDTLEELKAENSARGLVASWLEGMASGWVNTPDLFLIDKSTCVVSEPSRTNPAYHDCNGRYIAMRQWYYSDAVKSFIKALADFVPVEEYGELYHENNPNSYDPELDIFYDFNIDDVVNVLGTLVLEE
ncbi:hypothetical protein FBEOM_4840 [Fusarium beomiforme]|uniref:2EXR domain-containing protein n=1 Tax=Fusarium beomiforme TaxID=44412 RepID=A0A9P5AM30_9HYPO|nr:hypothetical protein FBEOM_4840 [Fusarium beomiforme]